MKIASRTTTRPQNRNYAQCLSYGFLSREISLGGTNLPSLSVSASAGEDWSKLLRHLLSMLTTTIRCPWLAVLFQPSQWRMR